MIFSCHFRKDLSLILVAKRDMVRCIVLLLDLWIPLTKGLTGARLFPFDYCRGNRDIFRFFWGWYFFHSESLISLVKHLRLVKHMLKIPFRRHRLPISFQYMLLLLLLILTVTSNSNSGRLQSMFLVNVLLIVCKDSETIVSWSHIRGSTQVSIGGSGRATYDGYWSFSYTA